MGHLNSFDEVKLLWKCKKHAVPLSLIVRNRKTFFQRSPLQSLRQFSFAGHYACFQQDLLKCKENGFACKRQKEIIKIRMKLFHVSLIGHDELVYS